MNRTRVLETGETWSKCTLKIVKRVKSEVICNQTLSQEKKMDIPGYILASFRLPPLFHVDYDILNNTVHILNCLSYIHY